MRDDQMPDQIEDSIDHNAGALSFVEQALSDLRSLRPINEDAIYHIKTAKRELRAAVRALKSQDVE
jgi:hypothetical protein